MINKKLVMIILSTLSLISGCATSSPQLGDIPPEGINQDQAAPYLDIGSVSQESPLAKLKK